MIITQSIGIWTSRKWAENAVVKERSRGTVGKSYTAGEILVWITAKRHSLHKRLRFNHKTIQHLLATHLITIPTRSQYINIKLELKELYDADFI